MQTSPQEDYEKVLHLLHEEQEKREIRILEAQVHEKMAERADYQAYYYRPAFGKYFRVSREAKEYTESILGD
jgi:NADH dehydrogenase (ubiquinone) 1 beta subcomplex subunit 5